MPQLLALVASDSGQDLVEYGLLTLLVSISAIAAVQLFGLSVGQLWTTIGTQLAAALS